MIEDARNLHRYVKIGKKVTMVALTGAENHWNKHEGFIYLPTECVAALPDDAKAHMTKNGKNASEIKEAFDKGYTKTSVQKEPHKSAFNKECEEYRKFVLAQRESKSPDLILARISELAKDLESAKIIPASQRRNKNKKHVTLKSALESLEGDRVVDVSTMGENGSGFRVIKLPKSTHKKHCKGLSMIADEESKLTRALEMLTKEDSSYQKHVDANKHLEGSAGAAGPSAPKPAAAPKAPRGKGAPKKAAATPAVVETKA